MRDVKVIKEMRDRVKEKVDALEEDKKLLLGRRTFSELNGTEKMTWHKIVSLKRDYMKYINALNFVLNEDCLLNNLQCIHKDMDEFIFDNEI